MPILTDGIRLARLKRSIGRDHADPRPLYPIEVAKYMQEMKDDLGVSSNKEIAVRLSLINQNPALVSNFLSLLSRPSIKFDDVWGWGGEHALVDGRIPFSMCRQLGVCYAKKIITGEDYEKIVSGVLNGKIPTSGVEEILSLMKKNPGKSCDDCCKEILNLIPEIIKSIVFIADLDSDVIAKINEKAIKESKSKDEIAESVLSKHFREDEIEGALLKTTYIKIAFSEKGREKLEEIRKKEGSLLSEIINHIFTKEGYGNE